MSEDIIKLILVPFTLLVIAGGCNMALKIEADERASFVDKGLQECPVKGSSYRVWQRECDQ